jgi:predicted esterase
MNTNPWIIPTDTESQSESQHHRIKHTTDRYKIMRRQTIALGISIGANLILVFLLGLIIIDPLYNRQWIARTPV